MTFLLVSSFLQVFGKFTTTLLVFIRSVCLFVCLFVCVCVWRKRKVGKTTTKKTPDFGDFVLGDFGVYVCFFCSSSFGFCDKQVTCLQHRERERERERERK